MVEESQQLGSFGLVPSSPSTNRKRYVENLSISASIAMEKAQHLVEKIQDPESTPSQISEHKEKLISALSNLKYLSKAIVNGSVGEEDKSAETLKALLEIIAACEKQVLEGQSKIEASRESNTHVESEFDKIEDRFRKAKAYLKSLSATVFPEQDAEFDALESFELGTESKVPPPDKDDAQFLIRYREQCEAFEQRVKNIEDHLIDSLARELSIEKSVAEKILHGGQTNWEGLVKRLPNGLIQQNHDIKHLKIYTFPCSQQLVADFGIGEFTHSSKKMVKELHRIGLCRSARLTSVGKSSSMQQKSSSEIQQMHKKFNLDIEAEMKARQALEKVPNIAGMTQIQYVNKKGKTKVRYVMEKYEGDLLDLIKKKKQAQALKCFEGVLQCIEGIHKLEFVHGDLKLDNVLVQADKGFVSDFGGMVRQGDNMGSRTLRYLAPEAIQEVPLADKRTDMFAVGMMLLTIAHPRLANKWFKFIDDSEKTIREVELESLPQILQGLKELCKDNLEVLQATLKTSEHPLDLLIHDLIMFNPQDRPTCTEARKRFTA